jgi:hypothetical protein
MQGSHANDSCGRAEKNTGKPADELELPGENVTGHRLKEDLVPQQKFDGLNDLTAGILGNRSFETGVHSLLG